MKRLTAILMVLALLLSAFGAAAETGSIRHMVTGDVSEFVVDEEKGVDHAHENEERTEATLGTDVYLFVDPDSASYITFFVTDEQGHPIEGALIYIGYGDVGELYGVTDENGLCSFYLFRNTQYSYHVSKTGYETAYGGFKATEETKLVHVILRKLHRLDVFVVDGETPVPNAEVWIDGEKYITDQYGHVQTDKPNGEYPIEVITEDGRHFYATAIIDGQDAVVIVDIHDDSNGSGNFLVYNKFYEPEDYVLTEYMYDGVETATVLVEAQCERSQLEKGDKDIYKPNGEKLYTQRSMMPTGAWLYNYEAHGFDKVVFTNEFMGIKFDINDLHDATMMKTWAMVYALTKNASFRSVVKPNIVDSYRWKESLYEPDLKTLKLRRYDLEAMDTFAFPFTGMSGKTIADSVFLNTLFEFRITPIVPESMDDMIRAGEKRETVESDDELLLLNIHYYLDELRKWQADGKLTDTEAAELYKFIRDSKLTGAELREIADQVQNGTISNEALEYLWTGAMSEKLYRVSNWIVLNTGKVNITEQMESMEIIWKADRVYKAEYQLQQEADPKANDAELEAKALDAMRAHYFFLTVDNQGKEVGEGGYAPGLNSKTSDAQVICSYPDPADPLYDAILTQKLPQLTVDVRHEELTLDASPKRSATGTRFKAYTSGKNVTLEKHFAFTEKNNTSGIDAVCYK